MYVYSQRGIMKDKKLSDSLAMNFYAIRQDNLPKVELQKKEPDKFVVLREDKNKIFALNSS